MVKIKEEQERHQQKIQRNFLEERLDKDILSKLEKIRSIESARFQEL